MRLGVPGQADRRGSEVPSEALPVSPEAQRHHGSADPDKLQSNPAQDIALRRSNRRKQSLSADAVHSQSMYRLDLF